MNTTDWLVRTELLIGEAGIARLQGAKILVVGLGGVGSFAAEFIGRSGVGTMTIVDGDVVDPTNKNRQLIALDSTVGQPKAAVMADRLRDINPALSLTAIQAFQEPGYMQALVKEGFDYVLDCIDSVQPKLHLIQSCLAADVRFISSMGAGGRIDPTGIGVYDIFATRNCPFAQQVRKSLRKKGVTQGFPVVSSNQIVLENTMETTDGSRFKKSYYGTISYLPALFGLHMAAHVIQELLVEH